MKTTLIPLLTAWLLMSDLNSLAQEKFPVLKISGQTYSNVTVMTVTTTDIYFSHAHGMGNAKLKNLDPELQKHFNFNAADSSKAERDRVRADAEFRNRVASAPRSPRPPEEETATPTVTAASGEDFVAPKLYAASFRGQPAPQLVVEKWLTAQPNTTGKFVLIDFWATWCGPCRRSIPEINAFFSKYGDRMAVIGLSGETEAAVRKMTSPTINYAVAIDPQQRMERTLRITGIPHCLLIDPQGIVRYEGMPQYLDDQKLEHFLAKYAK